MSEKYISRSIYFKDSKMVEEMDKFVETIPGCNLSKLVSEVMDKALPQLQKKDFLSRRSHQVTIEVTL